LNFGRVKNVLIVLLVIINAALAYNLFAGGAASGVPSSETINNTAEILGAKGLSIQTDMISRAARTGRMYALETGADEGALDYIASSLLGGCGKSSPGGGIVKYETEGTPYYLSFRPAGEVDALIPLPVAVSEGGEVKMLRNILRSAGFNLRGTKIEKRDGIVVLTKAVGGIPIEGMELYAEFMAQPEGGVLRITGRAAAGIERRLTAPSPRGIAGLLVDFAVFAQNNGISGEITGISPCYMIDGTYTERLILLPCYQIELGGGMGGVYRIDALSGKIISAIQ